MPRRLSTLSWSPPAGPTTGHCRSHHRRSIRTGHGPAPRCMCISAAKPSPQVLVSPASKRSGRCCWVGYAPRSGERCTINLKPVIDLPAGHTPVDAYEIPASLREQLLQRNPADVFPAPPQSAAVSTIPYLHPDSGGPPGKTSIGNLGPHTRRHHRYKTHGGWQVRQPEPGTWLWRSPHHRTYLVNATGTHPLGDTSSQKQSGMPRTP